MLTSQKVRELAPEQDPLRIGMGWTVDDLSKPQIMVESTFGDSHPGSAHLLANHTGSERMTLNMKRTQVNIEAADRQERCLL